MRFLQNISLLLVGLIFSFAWAGCPPANNGEDAPQAAAAVSGCDTCKYINSCAQFGCVYKPVNCIKCLPQGCDTCRYPSSCAKFGCTGKPPKCPSCTTVVVTTTPEFKATLSNENTTAGSNAWTADASSLRCLLRTASNGREELVLYGANSGSASDAISLLLQAPTTSPLVSGTFFISLTDKNAINLGTNSGKGYASGGTSGTINLTSFDRVNMTIAGNFSNVRVNIQGNPALYKVISGSFKNIKVTSGAITGSASAKSTLRSKVGSTNYTADGTGTKLVTSSILTRFSLDKIAVNTVFATGKILDFYIPIGVNAGTTVNLNDINAFDNTTRPKFTDGATSYSITTIPNANTNTLVITSHNRLVRNIKGTFSYTLEKGATQLPVTNGVFDVYY